MRGILRDIGAVCGGRGASTAQGQRHLLFVGRIARREFAHAGHGGNAFRTPAGSLDFKTADIERADLRAPVIQPAGDNKHMPPHGKTPGIKPRPGGKGQPHRVGASMRITDISDISTAICPAELPMDCR